MFAPSTGTTGSSTNPRCSVGNALLTSIFEQSLHKDGSKAPISYTGIIESSLADTSLAMLPLKSMMAPLEPLLPPILTPFVE